jgi:hypothetical protein
VSRRSYCGGARAFPRSPESRQVRRAKGAILAALVTPGRVATRPDPWLRLHQQIVEEMARTLSGFNAVRKPKP